MISLAMGKSLLGCVRAHSGCDAARFCAIQDGGSSPAFEVSMQSPAFALCGTVMHTPRRGSVEIIDHALVEVGDDGAIAAVTAPQASGFEQRKAQAERAGRLVTLAPTQVLLPGLIDLHVHAPQWPQAGKALHLPLDQWLQKHTFPLEARYADLEFARRIYSGLVDDLLANGTTTALYFATIHLDASVALAEICRDKGQRALVGRVAMDDPGQCPEYYRDASAEDGIARTGEFIRAVRALHGNGAGLIRPVVTPRFIPSCTDALLEGLGRLAAEQDCHIQTHCSESDWVQAHMRQRFGRSDTASLERFGLLSRHTILAHGNFVSDDDMDMIGAAGCGIAHCPLSNFYLSDAVFPLRRALDRNLHVGLGTDISGGHSPSLLDACRHALVASRALEQGTDPRRPAKKRGWPGARIDLFEAFWLATAGGAEALDLPVGRIAPGWRFDALLVDTDVAESNLRIFADVDSPEDVFQKIVYNAGRANIRKVWVEGALVVDKAA
jgi:guanine deaminase